MEVLEDRLLVEATEAALKSVSGSSAQHTCSVTGKQEPPVNHPAYR